MADEKTLDQLHVEMVKTFETMKDVNDKAIKEAETRGGQALAETREQLTKINTDLTELRAAYETKIKELQYVRPADGDEKRLSAQEMEHRAAYEKYLRFGVGDTSRVAWKPEEIRSLSSATDAGGAFLIPMSFETGIIMNAYNLAELRPLCQASPTSRDLVILGKLSKPTVAWGTKDVAVSPQELTAGDVRIPVIDLAALTLIHNNTLEDADSDVWGELQSAFDMAVAQAEDDAFIAGAGGELSPGGVLTNSLVLARYKFSGVAAALTDSTHNGVDVLISALYNLKKTYRRNATWAMNSTTEAVIRTLKDANGQYLWQPPVQAGTPATLLGRPLANPEGAPDIGAGTFPIVVGDWQSGYKIRDRRGITVQRLVERYAEYRQTGFLITKRVGGAVAKAEAFSCVKIATS